jgi:hypothetical protein
MGLRSNSGEATGFACREGVLRCSRRVQRRNGSANRSQDQAGVSPPNAHGDIAALCRRPWQNDGNPLGIPFEKPYGYPEIVKENAQHRNAADL